MIYLYCIDYNYELNKTILEYILNKYKFIKKVIIKEENEMYEYITKNDLFYKNNIYAGELEENLLLRISCINKCNNMYLLNLKKLNIGENYSYINNASNINNINVMILDFDINNINILNSYNYRNLIQLYSDINSLNNITYEKIYDVALIGSNSENKYNMSKKLSFNNVNIELINLDNINIYKYKIIINLEDDLDKSTLENLICNKSLIIQNKSIDIKQIKCNNDLLNKYTIDVNYESIPIFVLFILKIMNRYIIVYIKH